MRSHSFQWSDFTTDWYERWAKELLQDEKHRENFEIFSNKFWQNAVIAEALWERGVLAKGMRGIGFGVGQERLPSLFAKYNVMVTATDQDFKTQQAGHWAKYELANGTQSLNRIKICDHEKFIKHVSYLPVNMKKIPTKLTGKYDFAWSNCALGHLGSISDGVKFIEDSLQCLKPGGWAVHTTELNILSDGDTVSTGDTVVFRLKDIHGLTTKLIGQGYSVSPLVLTYGKHEKDKRISLMPQFGNDFSKIRIKDQIATQIVYIIHKPVHASSIRKKSQFRGLFIRKLWARITYLTNLAKMNYYKINDSSIRNITTTMKPGMAPTSVTPLERDISVKMTHKEIKNIRLAYRNTSNVALMGVSTPMSAQNVVLGTFDPMDRKSPFADKSWPSPSRPSVRLYSGTSKDTNMVEVVPPGGVFYVNLTLSAKKIDRGRYIEKFSLVQEHVGWIGDSVVGVSIEVV